MIETKSKTASSPEIEPFKRIAPLPKSEPEGIIDSGLGSEPYDLTEPFHGSEPKNVTDSQTTSAIRFNGGKPQLSMVLEARNALIGAARVMEYGATKYPRSNWRKGLHATKLIDSMMRHLTAFAAGETIDPESGLPHVDHLLCNALFLSETMVSHPEMDDRSLNDAR